MKATDILEQAQAHHRIQKDLCARLENVADHLPHNIDRQECLVLARNVYKVIKEAHSFEEVELFPYLQSQTKTAIGEIERLRFEHWEDEAYAEEISDILSSIGRDGEASDAEKVSWMLRGFFDGVRRHIAFEAEHLIPLLQSQLSDQTDNSRFAQ